MMLFPTAFINFSAHILTCNTCSLLKIQALWKLKIPHILKKEKEQFLHVAEK